MFHRKYPINSICSYLWGIRYLQITLIEERCAVTCLTVRDSVLALRFLAAESVSTVPEFRAERYFWAGKCFEVEVMAEE